MSTSFEAFIWNDVAIQAENVQLASGLYRVTVLRDERHQKDGAQLTSLDIPGEPTKRLTQAQFEKLDATRFFERR